MFDEALVGAVRSARTPSERVAAGARLENAACAARLSTMVDVFEAARAEAGSADREQWACDNFAAVCAQLGAAQHATSGIVSSQLLVGLALRERLPRVGAVFAAGLVTYRLVKLICDRTALVKDPAARAAVDAELAVAFAQPAVRSEFTVETVVDAAVARHDPQGVRHAQETARDRRVEVFHDTGAATSYVDARVGICDGQAFDQRLDLLAGTVCPADPRTKEQRRADAIGALGYGWDRLPCLCERPDCDAAGRPGPGGVTIHVLAHPDALHTGAVPDGTHPDDPGPAPGPGDEDGDGEKPRDSERCEVTAGASDTASEPGTADETVDADAGGGDADLRVPTGELAAQRRALHGQHPPPLPRPRDTYTWAELATPPGPGERSPARPGQLLGGPVLPAPVIANLALHATVTTLVHPAQDAPEPRYRPSTRLAAFVRARDQTCRFPTCRRRATHCDLDHVVPHPWGPTAAANLACLCREHHLLKTFWPGWSYTMTPDGTCTWTDPNAHLTVTHPGSRTLFPDLCAPTADVTVTGTPPAKHTAGLTMPRRRVTRTHARDYRINAERTANAQWAHNYTRSHIPPF